MATPSSPKDIDNDENDVCYKNEETKMGLPFSTNESDNVETLPRFHHSLYDNANRDSGISSNGSASSKISLYENCDNQTVENIDKDCKDDVYENVSSDQLTNDPGVVPTTEKPPKPTELEQTSQRTAPKNSSDEEESNNASLQPEMRPKRPGALPEELAQERRLGGDFTSTLDENLGTRDSASSEGSSATSRRSQGGSGSGNQGSGCSFCSSRSSSDMSSGGYWEPYPRGNMGVKLQPQIQILEEEEEHLPTWRPPPGVCTAWQYRYNMDSAGGEVSKPVSDIVLTVPEHAVREDEAVNIDVAVCGDFLQIYDKLAKNLNENEVIVTPLVEYWAGESFTFQKPVSISMPHLLPQTYVKEHVRVYKIENDNYSESFRMRPAVEFPNFQSLEQVFQESDPLSEPAFAIDGDVIRIITTHFCGFVCTYCDDKKKYEFPKLKLFAMCSGALTEKPSGAQHADVHLAVWDDRIKMEACRKEHNICEGDFDKIGLITDYVNSKLFFRLRQNCSQVCLRHRKDSNGKVLRSPPEIDFPLKQMAACKACIRKKKILPYQLHWALECPPGQPHQKFVELVADIFNIPNSVSNEDVDEVHPCTCTKLSLELCNQRYVERNPQTDQYAEQGGCSGATESRPVGSFNRNACGEQAHDLHDTNEVCHSDNELPQSQSLSPRGLSQSQCSDESASDLPQSQSPSGLSQSQQSPSGLSQSQQPASGLSQSQQPASGLSQSQQPASGLPPSRGRKKRGHDYENTDLKQPFSASTRTEDQIRATTRDRSNDADRGTSPVSHQKRNGKSSVPVPTLPTQSPEFGDPSMQRVQHVYHIKHCTFSHAGTHTTHVEKTGAVQIGLTNTIATGPSEQDTESSAHALPGPNNYAARENTAEWLQNGEVSAGADQRSHQDLSQQTGHSASFARVPVPATPSGDDLYENLQDLCSGSAAAMAAKTKTPGNGNSSTQQLTKRKPRGNGRKAKSPAVRNESDAAALAAQLKNDEHLMTTAVESGPSVAAASTARERDLTAQGRQPVDETVQSEIRDDTRNHERLRPVPPPKPKLAPPKANPIPPKANHIPPKPKPAVPPKPKPAIPPKPEKPISPAPMNLQNAGGRGLNPERTGASEATAASVNNMGRGKVSQSNRGPTLVFKTPQQVQDIDGPSREV